MKISRFLSGDIFTIIFSTAVNGLIVYAVSDLRPWACILCGYLMGELVSSAGTIKDLEKELDVLRAKLGRIEERMYKNSGWDN